MDNNVGWIKIRRDITKHWIAEDPRKFHWWIDLICMAAHNDYVTTLKSKRIKIGTGELIRPITRLAARWRVNRKTVARFLQLLESEGMIRRRLWDNYITHITICNYAKYQLLDDSRWDTSGGGSLPSQVDGEMDGNMTGQETEEVVDYLPAEEDTKKGVGCRLEQELIYNDSLSNIGAKGEKSKVETDADWYDRFSSPDSDFLKKAAEMLQIGESEMREYFDEFFTECEIKGTKHTGEGNFKRHFIDWARIGIQKDQREKKIETLVTAKKPNNNGTQKSYPNNRRDLRPKDIDNTPGGWD